MTHRLLAGLLIACATACGGGSAQTPAATPAPAAAPAPAPAPASQPCGYDIIGAAQGQGGACLEPAVMGAETATQCEAFLQQSGWQRDAATEAAIGQQTGKTLMCFRAPSGASPQRRP